MEFHNAKLLPRGLHEIMAALVPYEIYPDTKIIAIPRKVQRGLLGEAGTDVITNSYQIRLYPTIIAFYARGKGTFSFRLWMSYLKTALHEIGHLATYERRKNLHSGDGLGSGDYTLEAHYYIEKLADDWRDRALVKILSVSPRFGQPPGALTGYPGILAAKLRNSGRPWGDGETLLQGRVNEWRALGCDAQIPLGDLVSAVFYGAKYNEYISHSLNHDEYLRRLQKVRGKLRHAIHKTAGELGIGRIFRNRNGRRYLMFNAGEAETVYKRLADYNRDKLLGGLRQIVRQVGNAADPDIGSKRWQLIDGNWELVVDNSCPVQVPEQLELLLELEDEYGAFTDQVS